MATDTAPIGAISFFKGLGTGDLITIMQYTKTEDIEANTTVFHLGDPPNGLYVILKGRLRVYVPGKAGAPQKTLVVLEPGACVGEFGLIDGQPRSASVDTIEMTQLLFLPAPALKLL
jgi:CRP-like cAMP-binding protein